MKENVAASMIGMEKAETVDFLKRSRFSIRHFLLQSLLATATGLLSGGACVLLKKLLLALQWLFTGHIGLLADSAAALPLWRRGITPVLGSAIALLLLWIGVRVRYADNYEDYLDAVRYRHGEIPLESTFWRTIASACSVASGATIGREGSMMQFAAAVVSRFATTVGSLASASGWKVDRSRLVACGIAAAVACLYQAPVAGVFFALEIVTGSLVWTELPFFAIASYAGLVISQMFLGRGPLFPAIGPVIGPVTFPVSFDVRNAAWCLLLAVLTGASGPLYYRLIHAAHAARRLPLPLLWSGAAVGLLSLVRTEVWGNGDAALLEMMRQSPATHLILLILGLRLFATTLCVGTGTIGGVFTPTMFAGCAIGLLYARLLHLSSPLVYAIIGIGALLAAATHSPLMSAFMAVELTGTWHLLPLTLAASAIAWLVAHSLSGKSLYGLATPQPAREDQGST